MSRDSGGNYTLPAGNPVVTGTPITIAWANGTLNDISTVLTASLDRSGNGGMLAGLKGFDGLIGAPGFTFGSETGLGLYRVSAGVLGFAVGGSQVMRYSSAGLVLTGTFTPSGVILAADGAVGAPAFSFSADPDTGIYRVGGNSFALVTGGAARLTLASTGATFGPVILAPAGNQGAPSHSFSADTDTGMYSSVADDLRFTTGGVLQLTLTTTGANFSSQVVAPNGAVGTPSYAFTSDLDCGMYRISANTIGFSTNSVLQLSISTTALTAVLPFVALNAASAATPDLTFTGDLNTGFFSPSADELSFSLGGSAFAIGYRIIPQNIQAGNYTLLLTDSGKHIYHASGAGAGDTYTIPSNAAVAYTIGTVLTFVNNDPNSLAIAINVDTMTLAGTTTTGTRALAQNGIATAIKTTATTWLISGTGLS